MPIVTYHSTLVANLAAEEPDDTEEATSSQIILSRGVAGHSSQVESSDIHSVAPHSTSVTFLDPNRQSFRLGVRTRVARLEQLGETPQLDEMNDPRRAGYSPVVCNHRQYSSDDSTTTLSTHFEQHLLIKTGAERSVAHDASETCDFEPEFSNTTKYQDSKSLRGRAISRTQSVTNPLERAESRSRRDDLAIEIDVRTITQRPSRRSTLHEIEADPCSAFDDEFLEPFPHEPIAFNVHELMEASMPGTNSSPVSGFIRTGSDKYHLVTKEAKWITTHHTPTRASVFDGLRSSFPSLTLPPEIITELLPNVSHSEYLSVKSSCEHWKGGNGGNFDLKLQQASQLPMEVLQAIYILLPPKDFNSARRTCRSWFLKSLDKSLLETMLKRGGWWGSMNWELMSNQKIYTPLNVHNEWLMSKRIARECSLSSGWTGNGICERKPKQHRVCKHTEDQHTPFILVSIANFTDFGISNSVESNGDGNEKGPKGILFTVSTCGKFLILSHGLLVYVYELNRAHNQMDDKEYRSGDLKPITSIICPRRVIACSMDTSSNRDAIAILMDGRMGLVTAITGNSAHGRAASQKRYLKEKRDSISVSTSKGPQIPEDNTSIVTSRATTSHWFPVLAAAPEGSRCPGIIKLSSPPATASDRSNYMNSQEFPTTIQTSSTYRMPIEHSTPTIYTALCSADDPPRSVALCPQRRCVAFGCSSGIELHWVDALTGQDLNRWFPLTAPRDYLYFLPPRANIDSAKKLRLISSAGRSSEQPVIGERYANRRRQVRQTSSTGVRRRGLFWRAIGYDASSMEETEEIRFKSDHYHAVPLSDGHHVLFTDPITGLLCLGSDAPIGGPTKLLRKHYFIGPGIEGHTDGHIEDSQTLVTYAGGSDFKWGVRVVAAYGTGLEQSIWFYTIPADVFDYKLSEQFRSPKPKTSPGETEWMQWCGERGFMEGFRPALLGGNQGGSPLQVRGQLVGNCVDLVDLAIDNRNGITIWAFSRQGVSKTWKVDDGSIGQNWKVRKIFVTREGEVREADNEGDLDMPDIESASPFDVSDEIPRSVLDQNELSHDGPEGFDGAASWVSPEVLGHPGIKIADQQLDQPFCQPEEVERDPDGDMKMYNFTDLDALSTNLHEMRIKDHSEESLENVSLWPQSYANEYVDFPESITRLNWESSDLIEEQYGTSRIDIEIE